jgi:hypothetical protein
MIRASLRPAMLSLLAVAGCTGGSSTGTTESGGSADGTSTSASGTATGTATTTSSGTSGGSASAGTSSGSASGSSDDTGTGTSTGGPVCPPGDEPSDASTVRDCPLVGEAFCSEGTAHVAQGSVVPWMHDPPHSGPHYPTWEIWGEHAQEVPRGNWVHNLEHGGVVFLHACPGGCDPELEVLRAVIAARPGARVLITYDSDLPGPDRFAAVSWTWVHRFDAPDLVELLCFVDEHEGHAPEDVP